MRESNPTLDRFSRPAWSLAAGVLLGLSLPPVGLSALAWVALVPLLARWATARTVGHVARDTYAALLLTSAIVFGWVLLHPFAGKALLSGLGLLLLPLPLVGAFTLSALVRLRLGFTAGVAALFTGVLGTEWLLTQGNAPFPWLLLGHTQAEATVFNGIAALGGVPLLSLWVLTVNGLFFAAVRAAKRPGPLPGPRALAALLAVAVLAAPAAYVDSRVIPPPTGTVRVGIVQPATAAADWAQFTDGTRVDTLAHLSDRLLPGVPSRTGAPVRAAALAGPPALVVWPEAALPVFGDAAMERRLYARLGVWASRRGTALLTGALTTPASAPSPVTGQTDTDGAYYSSALLFANGQVQEYDRMHLVPGLERTPLGSAVPAQAAPPTPDAHYAAGTRRALLHLDSLSFAAPIGDETLLGDHMAGFAADGARFFVALVNNGWWGPAPSAEQQIQLSRLRAIETRRAVVVATVNGVSGLLLPDGSVQRLTAAGERAMTTVDVPLYTGTTAYVQHGDRIGGGAALVAALLGLVGIAAAVAKRTAQKPKRRPAARPLVSWS